MVVTYDGRKRGSCSYDSRQSCLHSYPVSPCDCSPRPYSPISATCHVSLVHMNSHVSRSNMPFLRMSITDGVTERLSSAVELSKSIPVDHDLLVESLRELMDGNVRMVCGWGGCLLAAISAVNLA